VQIIYIEQDSHNVSFHCYLLYLIVALKHSARVVLRESESAKWAA
jgi:hypothetical protein